MCWLIRSLSRHLLLTPTPIFHLRLEARIMRAPPGADAEPGVPIDMAVPIRPVPPRGTAPAGVKPTIRRMLSALATALRVTWRASLRAMVSAGPKTVLGVGP